MSYAEFDAIRIGIASPEQIRGRSHPCGLPSQVDRMQAAPLGRFLYVDLRAGLPSAFSS